MSESPQATPKKDGVVAGKTPPAAGRATRSNEAQGMGAARPGAHLQGRRHRDEILKRCTGPATIGTIVEELAKTYDAPGERILIDITRLVQGLADKKLLEL